MYVVAEKYHCSELKPLSMLVVGLVANETTQILLNVLDNLMLFLVFIAYTVPVRDAPWIIVSSSNFIFLPFASWSHKKID